MDSKLNILFLDKDILCVGEMYTETDIGKIKENQKVYAICK